MSEVSIKREFVNNARTELSWDRVIYKLLCAGKFLLTNYCVLAVMLATLVTPLAIFLHASASICLLLRIRAHMFKHLNSEVCRSSCSSESITILDSTAAKFQIKLKQAMYINWEKPVLNYILLICLSLFNFHVSYVFFFFASLFSYTFHCSFVVTV